MKLIKALTPIGIALPGLLGFEAQGGYTTQRSYQNPSQYSTAGSVSSGTTQAKYSGSMKTIDYVNLGYATFTTPPGWPSPLTTPSSTMNTLVIESATWNPGCYSMGISEVWPPGMSDSGIGETTSLPNINNTGFTVGAWDEIY